MVRALQHGTLEERIAHLHRLEAKAPQAVLDEYKTMLEMTWIYHDAALEGTVYLKEELRGALGGETVTDTSLIPIYDEIRQHRAGIRLIDELSKKKRLSIDLDLIKKIYAVLAPEECDARGVPRYRKEMPLHRQYFHELSSPDKIASRMRNLITWINSANTKKTTHEMRVASRAHYQMVHIYPFPKQSGKVARLLMNLMLARSGYPPAILHATERQRYYECLKTSEDAAAGLVRNAVISSMESAIGYLESRR